MNQDVQPGIHQPLHSSHNDGETVSPQHITEREQ